MVLCLSLFFGLGVCCQALCLENPVALLLEHVYIGIVSTASKSSEITGELTPYKSARAHDPKDPPPL